MACLLAATLGAPAIWAARPGGGPSEMSAPVSVAQGGDYEIVASFRTGSPMAVALGPGASAPPSAISRLVLVLSPTEVTEIELNERFKPPGRDVTLHVFVAPDAGPGGALQFVIEAGGEKYSTRPTTIEAG